MMRGHRVFDSYAFQDLCTRWSITAYPATVLCTWGDERFDDPRLMLSSQSSIDGSKEAAVTVQEREKKAIAAKEGVRRRRGPRMQVISKSNFYSWGSEVQGLRMLCFWHKVKRDVEKNSVVDLGFAQVVDLVLNMDSIFLPALKRTCCKPRLGPALRNQVAILGN